MLIRPMVGRRERFRITTLARRLFAALCMVLWAVATAQAQPREVYDLDLPAQSLADALNGLSEQTGVPVVFPYDLVKNRSAAPVTGRYTLTAALDALLQGTGLSGGLSKKGVLTISMAKSRSQTAGETAVTHDETTKNRKPIERSARTRIAAFLGSIATAWSAAAQDSGREANRVEEVVVTAQKQGEQRLQDVPIPVSVLSADSLAQSSRVLLREYYNTVPSFNLVTNFGFTQNINIRGITTGGFSNPTVGITIDDVPYGSSINNGGGNQVPDIDPGDLARIEVLRGPQGTMYGANSMGGLVRYVTKDPSLSEATGSMEVGVSSVRDGDEPGYNVRASGNILLAETLAARVSGYTRTDPGYIDNPLIGRDDVNEAQSHGGRLSLLWRPTDAFSAKLTTLYQRTDLKGNPDVLELPGLGDLEQSYMPNVGSSDREIQAYSLILDVDLGFGRLKSTTAYNTNEYENSFDRSANWSTNTLRHFGVSGLSALDWNTIRKFSQEVTLAGDAGQALKWAVGAFFTEEDTRTRQNFRAAEQATGQVVGTEWFRDVPITLRDYAAFANLTYQVTERFDIQVGGRQSYIRENDGVFAQSGPFVGGTVLAAPSRSRADAFTYLITPRFTPAADLMIYARLASGYRPGGPNFPTEGAPAQYQPDKTQNYELGIKGEFLDGALTLDASIYYIDWKDLQISLRQGVSTYFTNGSRARSQGVELSSTLRPFAGTTISGWVAYNDAELAERFPGSGTAMSPVYGEAGDRLPNSARHSAYLSIEQDVLLSGRLTGFVGAAATYTGDRVGVFAATPVRQEYPSYSKFDLRAGVKYDSWTTNFFVNNLSDERGVIGGGIGYQPTFAFTYIQPRTIGLSVSKEF